MPNLPTEPRPTRLPTPEPAPDQPKPVGSLPSARLPTGFVTFLLTDLEGSTALWDRDPEAMRPALARHDALVGTAVERHGGTLIRAQGAGDSHLAVFTRVGDAVSAARAIQDAIVAEPWSTPTPLRIRIGLHTGEAEVRDGGYYGAAFNRCARLLEIGHGGEIVLSEVTASLVRDAVPAGWALRDLGERRLRGLSRAEHAYQLVPNGAPTASPTARALDGWPRTLPVETTSLVGRGRDLEQIQAMIRSGARIVTLTGPGGVGKTRLAIQVAAELAGELGGGAAFVALATVVDPTLVGPTIAHTLGVQELPGQSVAETLIEHLRSTNLVLVLDNFEQVATAAPLVNELLGAASGLRVLVTSRALLHISGEHDHPVQPLAVPVGVASPVGEHAVDEALGFEAVRLFVERARALKPDFALSVETAPIVVEICRRLDGLPLAIELAAARARLLPPRALLARLERRLPLLTAGPADLPVRQQTLRGAIAWSYDLLDSEEKRLFRLLAVFAGGISLDAAERVVSGAAHPSSLDTLEGLASLLDKSLLRTVDQPDDEPRYAMLDTIREYGLEQLEAGGDLDDARRRHATYFLTLAEDAEARLAGPDQARWLDRLDLEHDNLRAALQWYAEHDAGSGLRLAAALWRFWYVRAYFAEGRSWLARLLTRPEAGARTITRALALNGAGNLAYNQGDYATAEACHQESLEIRGELGDRQGIAGSLNNLGLIARDRGDFARAIALFEEAVGINRTLGNRTWEAINLGNLGIALHEADDLARARALLDESLGIFRSLDDQWGLGMTLSSLAAVAGDGGDVTTARTLYAESLECRRRVGDRRGIAATLFGLGRLSFFAGDPAAAGADLRASLALASEIGDRPGTARALEALAALAATVGQVERAAGLLGAAEALREGLEARMGWLELQTYREARAATDAGGPPVATARAEGRARPERAVERALAAPPEPARDESSAATSERPFGRDEAPMPLTRREREVATLVARGLTNRQIAAELVIAERTADTHVANILGKLGFGARAQVAAWAVEHGLLDPRSG